MATAYLGEIRLFAGNFAPHGWALCDGQLLAINQNQALFAILGITYGGNGQTTFALPNLQARAPMHQGLNFTLGQQGGESRHTLLPNEMPTHTHVVQAIGSATTHVATPSLNMAADTTKAAYAPAGGTTQAMAANAVTTAGGSQSHDNMPPYLAVSFIIALQGIFPSRN